MSAAVILHYFFLIAAAIATILLLLVRNVLYGALLLIIVLLSLAGLYVLSFAEFLAIAQILVYAGGVLVLIIFAIMLTSQLNDKPLLIDHSNRFAGSIVGITLFAIMTYLLGSQIGLQASDTPELFSVPTLGRLMMTGYVLPFELTGIVLLVALIGAAVIASAYPSKRP